MLTKSQLTVNAATATMLCVLAFAATAGGEFVREGVRKPYTVRHALYSNSITEDEVAMFRRIGCTSQDPYPVANVEQYPTKQLRLGAHVFRMQCGICHTMDGANGLVHLAGTWSLDQQRLNIAKLQHTKAFMPPFAGTPEELEALVQLIRWTHESRPDNWPEELDPQVVKQIATHLEQAGTQSLVPRP